MVKYMYFVEINNYGNDISLTREEIQDVIIEHLNKKSKQFQLKVTEFQDVKAANDHLGDLLEKLQNERRKLLG